MSIPSVQAAARAAPAEAPVPAASRAAFASMERRMRDFAGPASQLPAVVSGGVSPSS